MIVCFLKTLVSSLIQKLGRGGPLGPPAHHYVIVYSNDGRVVEIENKDGKMTEVPSPYLLLFPGDYIYYYNSSSEHKKPATLS